MIKEEIKTDVSEEIIKEIKISDKPLVCFVCTGNTCRSPMAAAYLSHTGAARAISAGCAAHEGAPIFAHAVRALEEQGILSAGENDYKNHTATQLERGIAAKCDIIVAMTQTHASQILLAFPEYASKVRLMPRDIPDPYGGYIEAYRACLSQIMAGGDDLFVKDGD